MAEIGEPEKIVRRERIIVPSEPDKIIAPVEEPVPA
jgi:hypothetical protein